MAECSLNWLSDDWTAISTMPSSASASDVTTESLLEMMQQLKAIPRPDFDAIVCLPAAYRILKEAFPEVKDGTADRLLGIPIYLAYTAVEAALIAAKLKGEGKRVVVMFRGGDPREILDLPPMPEPRRPAPPILPPWLIF